MDQNDLKYNYTIEGIDVEIIGHNDTICGWGWQFFWNFKDATEWNRIISSGPFETKDEVLQDVKEHIRLYGPYKNIQIYTSYFGRIDYLKKYNYTNLISIAGKTPDDFNGRKYLDLAPKYSWWKEWKDNGYLNQWYIDKYYETVLNNLNPEKVRKELGYEAVLLCYEKPGQFCHRRIVAKWFEDKFGIEVKEI